MTKIAIGCGLLSISFAVLMFGALPIDSHASPARVSVVWIVLNQIFLTSGELFTFPVALSYISKIAPERLLSAIIGLWFGSSFFGNYFSGLVGSTYPDSRLQPSSPRSRARRRHRTRPRLRARTSGTSMSDVIAPSVDPRSLA